MKKIFKKTPTKLSWPTSTKSDRFFILFKKKKKITMAHVC